MKIAVIKADITTVEADAIVNASNSSLIIGGGVDGAIHKAAGQELINYNAQHHGFGCPTGQVKVSPGFNLPAKFILHTVGPDMRLYNQTIGGDLLEMCYFNSMKTAINEGLKSIAFPSISTGIYGFDKERAARIAVDVMYEFDDSDIEVTFACFSDEDVGIIQQAVDDKDAEIHLLTWSIGDWVDYKDDFINDISTDAPDGVWDVYTTHLGNTAYANGVTTKNGKFVMEPTLRACAKARNNAGYHGTFLEGIVWNDEADNFTAHFGS